MLLPPGIKAILGMLGLFSSFSTENKRFIEHRCVDSIAFSPCPGFIVDGEVYEPLSMDKPVIVSNAGCLDFLTG